MESGARSHSWTCPACSRRVPPHITECRCGVRQADTVAAGGTLPDDEPAPRSSSLLLVGGLVLGAAVAMVPVWSMVGSGAPATGGSERTRPATDAGAGETRPALDAGRAGRPRPATEPAGQVLSDLPNDLGPAAPPAALPAAATRMALEDIVSRVVPAVATIDAGRARGTGFFIRPDQVLTNAHVVEGQTSVRLQVGSASYTARVASIATGSDLAVLQVYNPNPNQPTVRLGAAATARVGQEVIAIGSALGVLSNTVTRGIVSAVRQAGAVTLIQTDAAINPGNSGGPLVDRSGLVIGINSIGHRSAQGLAFAVAIEHATQLLSGQATPSAQTPLSALQQDAGGPSDGDHLRERGEQAYAQVVQAAARNADQLDTYWGRYSGACVASSTRAGGRSWFSVYEPNGVRITATSQYNCESWLDTLQKNAADIRGSLDDAAEAARRSGVYPGVMRDIRRRHRMDWAGWDR